MYPLYIQNTKFNDFMSAVFALFCVIKMQVNKYVTNDASFLFTIHMSYNKAKIKLKLQCNFLCLVTRSHISVTIIIVSFIHSFIFIL